MTSVDPPCAGGHLHPPGRAGHQRRMEQLEDAGMSSCAQTAHQRGTSGADSAVRCGQRQQSPNVAPTIRAVTWVPDSDAPACTSCAKRFTLFRRRHHCRACGQVFCDGCSSQRIDLGPAAPAEAIRCIPTASTQRFRACNDCAESRLFEKKRFKRSTALCPSNGFDERHQSFPFEGGGGGAAAVIHSGNVCAAIRAAECAAAV